MRKFTALGFLILLITFGNKSMAQTDAIQNDITIEDKLVEVTAICIDAIEALQFIMSLLLLIFHSLIFLKNSINNNC